jgi:hypothetical protein
VRTTGEVVVDAVMAVVVAVVVRAAVETAKAEAATVGRDAVLRPTGAVTSVEVEEASGCRCAEGGTGESAEARGTGTKALFLA